MQGVRPGTNSRQQARQQAYQPAHVVFAIFENFRSLLWCERRPLQDTIAHCVLVREVEAFELEEIERPIQSAVAIGPIVDVMAKLN